MRVDDAAESGTTVRSPGSQGEHLLQSAYHTAERFYHDQVCNRLLPTMVEFVGRMEMVFVATADGPGECDATLRAGPAGFVQVLTRGIWPTRSIGATVCWPAWATSARTRMSGC